MALSLLVTLLGSPPALGKPLPAPPSGTGFSVLCILLKMRAEAQGGDAFAQDHKAVSGWDETQVSLAQCMGLFHESSSHMLQVTNTEKVPTQEHGTRQARLIDPSPPSC